MAVSQVLAIVMALACVSEAIVSIPVHRHRVSRRIARDEVTMLSGSSYTAPIPPDSYMIYVSIGTPPQQLKLLVDTGSSNLAVSISAQAGGPPPYFQAASSSTYQLVAANALDMEYVVGDWRGDIVQDIVTVENAPNISLDVSFGTITSSSEFFTEDCAYNGILGMAYSAIAQPQSHPIPPYFDQLVSANLVPNAFALQLCMPENAAVDNGKMVLGGYDPSLSYGTPVYTPLMQQGYYSVLVTDFAVNGASLGLACGAYNSPSYSIVDSGTTELLVPQAVFNALIGAIPEGLRSYFSDQNNVYVPPAACDVSQPSVNCLDGWPTLTIYLAGTAAGTEFPLTIRPWHYMRVVQDQFGAWTFQSAIVPACNEGSGITLGVVAMTEYQVVFDRANSRLGFAPSTCAQSSQLGPPPAIAIQARVDQSSCEAEKVSCSPPGQPSIFTIYFWVAVICGGLAVILVIGSVVWCFVSKGPRTRSRYEMMQNVDMNSSPRGYDTGRSDGGYYMHDGMDDDLPDDNSPPAFDGADSRPLPFRLG
eukprot:m.214015 g.214015  ORF g.214015 m.214015 type:complete len:534 (-) comp10143_c3_seq1:213-1814(-)